MHALIVNNHSDDIQSLLHSCTRNGVTFDVIEALSLRNAEMSYDLVILSGGLWYEDPTQQELHYGAEIKMIAESNMPILGICLGMQLMAASFGGELLPLKREYHGTRHIELTSLGKELLAWPEDFQVYENHTVGVTKAPNQFDVLATSEECAEIIKHKHRPLAGVQFHPEKLHKKEHAFEIWDSLLRLIKQ